MTISLFSVITPTTVASIPTNADGSEQPSSVAANKLVDTANDFSNVSIGDYVVLWEDPRVFTTVTALDSATQLSLADDIITSTDQYYLVVTAADAFKVTLDTTSGEGYNFEVFCAPGDLVETSGQDIEQTLSGCRVVSIDSPTQITVDLPFGGYSDAFIGLQKNLNTFDADGIDVFYYDNSGPEIVVAPLTGDSVNYASLYPYGLADSATTGAVMLSDLKDAIVEAVGGGYRTNAPINQRAFGPQYFDI